MKKLLYIVFLFFTGFANSQSTDEMLQTASMLHNSNPDSAYTICFEVEKLAVQQKDSVLIANCNLCKIRYLLLRNKLEKAATLLEQTHNIFTKNNDKQGLAKTYTAMANIAGRIRKDQQEIEFLEEAYKIVRELNDTTQLLKNLTNLALNYTHYGLMDKAQSSLEELETLSAGMPKKEYYYLNQNWGIFYSKKGNSDAALRRYGSAKKIAYELNMTDSKATILYLIASEYLKINDAENALKNINQSYDVANRNNLQIEKLEALELLNKIYEQKKQVDKAYEVYKQIASIKDSAFNLAKINRLNEYEKKIALSEKENIITSQKLNLEKQNTQLVKDKYRFYILLAVILVISISLIMLYNNLRSKKKANRIISRQKEEVEKQKMIVEDKNFQILSSITYAKRIQEAILPQDKLVKEYLEKSFIYYQPKDIVSGDFYWMEQVGDKILFAVVDCTGHGVPGAFMSIVGNNGLNKAVRELKLTQPSKILDALNLHLNKSLHLETTEVKDGMDIAICSLDLKTNVLEYAGAFNPLYLLKKSANEIEIIKADKQAIGSAKDLYKNHSILLSAGDLIYIFTDGYADQFGGDNNKKIGYKQFRDYLLEMRESSMLQQREILEQKMQLWKGNEEQIDDICVIGVKI